jgi:hypothetical protein
MFVPGSLMSLLRACVHADFTVAGGIGPLLNEVTSTRLHLTRVRAPAVTRPEQQEHS